MKRVSAAQALASLQTEKAHYVVLKHFKWGLKESPYRYIDAMAMINSKESRMLMAEAMSDMEIKLLKKTDCETNPFVMIHLALTLDKLGETSGMKALHKWLDPIYPVELRVGVIEKLGKERKSLLNINLIQKYANDNSRRIREAVIKALAGEDD